MRAAVAWTLNFIYVKSRLILSSSDAVALSYRVIYYQNKWNLRDKSLQVLCLQKNYCIRAVEKSFENISPVWKETVLIRVAKHTNLTNIP